ncbi:hypothetical protein EMCRGX_G032736 [Ephydatia muelleri]
MWRAGLVNQEQSLANFMHSGDVPSQLGTGGRKEATSCNGDIPILCNVGISTGCLEMIRPIPVEQFYRTISIGRGSATKFMLLRYGYAPSCLLLSRKGNLINLLISMVVDEEGPMIYHTLENTRIYQEKEMAGLAIREADAPAIEQLLTSYPDPIAINKLGSGGRFD